MNTDTLRERVREQVRQALARQGSASPAPSPAGAGTGAGAGVVPKGAVLVPLRVGSPQDAATLAQLFQRLAASPALMKMADAGLLRFDLRVDASALQQAHGGSTTSAMAATTAIDPATCCASCKAGKACECGDTHCSTHDHAAVAELAGVIGERQVKALAPGVHTVQLKPGAVLTPLGKEALRKRGITIDKGAAR